jgi:hypothetical protein
LTDNVNSVSFITKMIARGRRRAKRKPGALGSFISREARELERLTNHLTGRWVGEHAQLGEQVAAVIEAAAAVPYPAIARRAGELFMAIAEGHTLRYTLHVPEVAADAPAAWRRHGLAMVILSPSTPRDSAAHERGYAAQELDRFFRNSARDRLRRCEKCRTWFIDTTRNQSAKRCSRQCTIAWSNSQRAMKRTTKRKRGSR